jgi:hypothetical protein
MNAACVSRPHHRGAGVHYRVHSLGPRADVPKSSRSIRVTQGLKLQLLELDLARATVRGWPTESGQPTMDTGDVGQGRTATGITIGRLKEMTTVSLLSQLVEGRQ